MWRNPRGEFVRGVKEADLSPAAEMFVSSNLTTRTFLRIVSMFKKVESWYPVTVEGEPETETCSGQSHADAPIQCSVTQSCGAGAPYGTNDSRARAPRHTDEGEGAD